MNAVVRRRLLLMLLLPACALIASCRSSESIVDLSPLGEAIRFLAIAMVLGCIVIGIFQNMGKD
jgi:hypothetical protein